MGRTEAPIAVERLYMGYQPDQLEKLKYPKLQFFLLTLLGDKDFVRKAKQEIDAINHLREKGVTPKPPKRGTGRVDPYPERGRKFDESDIYILSDKKINKIYNKKFDKNNINYIDIGNMTKKEAYAAIEHEAVHFLALQQEKQDKKEAKKYTESRGPR